MKKMEILYSFDNWFNLALYPITKEECDTLENAIGVDSVKIAKNMGISGSLLAFGKVEEIDEPTADSITPKRLKEDVWYFTGKTKMQNGKEIPLISQSSFSSLSVFNNAVASKFKEIPEYGVIVKLRK